MKSFQIFPIFFQYVTHYSLDSVASPGLMAPHAKCGMLEVGSVDKMSSPIARGQLLLIQSDSGANGKAIQEQHSACYALLVIPQLGRCCFRVRCHLWVLCLLPQRRTPPGMGPDSAKLVKTPKGLALEPGKTHVLCKHLPNPGSICSTGSM